MVKRTINLSEKEIMTLDTLLQNTPDNSKQEALMLKLYRAFRG